MPMTPTELEEFKRVAALKQAAYAAGRAAWRVRWGLGGPTAGRGHKQKTD